METTIVYWGYIGRMEKKIETTIMGYIGTSIRIHSFTLNPKPVVGDIETTIIANQRPV